MHCNENHIYVFLFWELCGLSTNFHIHVSVSYLYIPRIGPHISLQKICTPGWRANKDPVQQILPKVQEALKQLKESDVVIIQCLDNTAYYSRTEEGGDIPIRKYDNKFHVEEDLVLGTKERQRNVQQPGAAPAAVGQQKGDTHHPITKVPVRELL